jgi:hypothetical protein
MSTSNIITQFSIPVVGYFVVFAARDGARVYGFSESEGAEIESGADPQNMNGVRIRSISDVLTMVGRNLPDTVIEAITSALAEFL